MGKFLDDRFLLHVGEKYPRMGECPCYCLEGFFHGEESRTVSSYCFGRYDTYVLKKNINEKSQNS